VGERSLACSMAVESAALTFLAPPSPQPRTSPARWWRSLTQLGDIGQGWLVPIVGSRQCSAYLPVRSPPPLRPRRASDRRARPIGQHRA